MRLVLRWRPSFGGRSTTVSLPLLGYDREQPAGVAARPASGARAVPLGRTRRGRCGRLAAMLVCLVGDTRSMSLTIVGAGLGRTGTTFAPRSARHRPERPRVPHGRGVRQPRQRSDLACRRRRCADRLEQPARRLPRDAGLASGHLLARHRSGQPGGSRTAVHPLQRRGVVEQREQDAVRCSRSRLPASSAADEGHERSHVREVHAAMAGPRCRDGGLRRAQRRRAR